MGGLIEQWARGQMWNREEASFSGVPILPTGDTIDMRSPSSNKWWDNGTFEVWQREGGRAVVVRTSGQGSMRKIGDTSAFVHDQTRRKLFFAELVGYVTLPGGGVEGNVPTSGRFPLYTYK